MSQRVDLDEQRSYQAPTGYNGTLYQGPQAYPIVSGGLPGQTVVQPNKGESTTSRHRLILALCSLVALAIACIAFASVLETWTAPYMGVFALIGLGIVSVSIVAINVAFNLKR
jgi:hypothetical protein